MGSAAGWTPVADTSSAWKPVQEAPAEPKSNVQRFAQSWWDNSVLKHPIDSAVGLVKSLITMPDYHTLTPEEKAHVDDQVEKAFHEAAHPTPELAGQVASSGTNAAMIAGATAGLGKGLGAVVDNADVIKGAARGAGNAITETAHFKGFDIPGGNVMAGAGGGSIAAHAIGLPGELGAVVGGAAPIIKGAIKGGRSALAARISKAALEDKILHPQVAASMLESLNSDDEIFHPPTQAAAGAAETGVPIPPSPATSAGPVRPPLASDAAVVEDSLAQHMTGLEGILHKSIKDPVMAREAVDALNETLKQKAVEETAAAMGKNQGKRALRIGKYLQENGVPHTFLDQLGEKEWKLISDQISAIDKAPFHSPSAATIQKTKAFMQMAAGAGQ